MTHHIKLWGVFCGIHSTHPWCTFKKKRPSLFLTLMTCSSAGQGGGRQNLPLFFTHLFSTRKELKILLESPPLCSSSFSASYSSPASKTYLLKSGLFAEREPTRTTIKCRHMNKFCSEGKRTFQRRLKQEKRRQIKKTTKQTGCRQAILQIPAKR